MVNCQLTLDSNLFYFQNHFFQIFGFKLYTKMELRIGFQVPFLKKIKSGFGSYFGFES